MNPQTTTARQVQNDLDSIRLRREARENLARYHAEMNESHPERMLGLCLLLCLGLGLIAGPWIVGLIVIASRLH